MTVVQVSEWTLMTLKGWERGEETGRIKANHAIGWRERFMHVWLDHLQGEEEAASLRAVTPTTLGHSQHSHVTSPYLPLKINAL